MLKAQIINLTTKLDFHNKQDTFVNAIKEIFDFLDIDILTINNICDKPEKITEALSQALSTSQIIITIGGLGAHLNDCVKQSLIKGLSLPTVLNENLLEKFCESNPDIDNEYLKPMASFPQIATVFECDNFPAFAIRSKEQVIISLPDIESDCKKLLSGKILSYLCEITQKNFIIESRVFPIIDESFAQNKLSELSSDNLCVTFYNNTNETVVLALGDADEVKDALSSALILLKNDNATKIKSDNIKENTPKEKGKRKIGKWFFNAILGLFITVAVVSVSYLGIYYYSSYKNAANNDEIRDILSSSTDDVNAPKEIIPELRGVYAQNNDTVGWIKVNGTQIDYPVLKYTDNEFYLKKDFNKKTNKHGIPFADYTTDFEKPSDNIVIYSHNMKDGQMFSDLIKYRKTDFYKQHPIIEFNSLYSKDKYKIFSVFITNVNEEHGEVFNYHNGVDFNSDEDFMKYVYNAQIRSMLDIPVDVNEDDKLLTLSTCTYEFDDARLVVMARKVRENEDLSVDTNNVKISENPLMPDIWYKLYGGSAPVVETFKYTPKIQVDDDFEIAEIFDDENFSQISYQESSSSNVLTTSSSEVSSSKPPESSQVISSSSQVIVSEPSSSSSAPVSSSEQLPSSSEVAPPLPSSQEETSSSSIPPSSQTSVENSSEKPSSSKKEESSSSQSSEEPTGSSDDYISKDDAFDEILTATINGKTVEMDAYTLISQIVENETRGRMHIEATKAQAVAAYTYVKYYNERGIAPSVLARTDVTSQVKKAVAKVLGITVKYNGSLINATYHSTSRGQTASSKYVWGTALPYLVPVDSPYDELSPYFKNTYKISEEDFADKVFDVFGIDLYDENIDPEDWIYIDESKMCPGGYVGSVEIGGYNKSLGGTVAKNTEISGRNIREKLLNFALKSTSFDVQYKNGYFTFTTYGYGHGVGMSQWGAQGMAQDGYTFDEILTYYYTGTYIE